GGTLSGTTTVAAVGGLATFSSLSITKAGTGYTLTASSTGLTSATSSAFDISDVAPTALTYSTNPATYTKGTAITDNTPASSGGTVVSYSVSPALPTGLACSASTGVISGTPMALSVATGYTVTATNSGGSTTVGVSITVNDVAPPAPAGLTAISGISQVSLSWIASSRAT